MDDAGGGLHEQFERRLQLTEVFDREGFYAYHLAEHHSTPLGYASSPGIFLAAVAQRTKKLRFGPLVYLLPFYHPIRLLEEICMLDQMSKGRLELGVGRGISPVEARFYGLDPAVGQDMYHEAFEIIREGLTGDELHVEGKFYKVGPLPLTLKPFQKPHPPLWYGVTSPESTAWAAANDVNVVTIAQNDRVKQIADRYRSEWAALGKPAITIPKIGVSRHVVVAETQSEALKIANRAYPRWRESFNYLWDRYSPEAKRTPIAALYPPTFDELQAIGNGFAGSPEAAFAYVRDTVAATNINYFVSWFAFGDLTFEESRRSVELFARAVVRQKQTISGG